jgi:LacI family gluconate utilization system Gnt-I transcriptional repressor
MFAQTGYQEMLDKDIVSTVLPFRPAGVVFTGVVRSEESRASLRRLGIPVLEMWGYRPDPIDMLVGFSNRDGGLLMGNHLGEQGYRKVAYCGYAAGRGAERIDGLKEGLAKHGAELVAVVPTEENSQVSDGIAAFDRVKAEAPEADVIFFGTDVLATGAMIRANHLGIIVPDDIAIAGYGDFDFAEHLRPSLTTVKVASYDIGLEGGRMLRRRLEGHDVARPLVIQPGSLEARQSTERKR